MARNKPEFPSRDPSRSAAARRLTASEAAQLADDVLERARAALRQGPPAPVVARRAAPAPLRARRLPARAMRWQPPAMAPMAECLVIAMTLFACLLGVLAQQIA